ncbi:hypothetical protein AND_008337 [Anopheles darlingi]|uniref:Uncharacterized protein n=1 Tax=Anopheles darlingi TaxID=43151 RepID=W5JBB6_ANODA|nr:hypothetical protein AND_008337 [Anopheles darlingi]
MAGFLPLAESVVTPIYLPVTVEMDMDPKTGRAVHALRVYQVLQFGHWLCGQKPSVLGLQSSGTPDTHFVYVTQQPSSSGGGDAPQHGSGGTDAAAASVQQPSIDDGEENLRRIARVPEERHRLPTVEEENQPPDADASETSQLAHRMQELKRQKFIQERYERRRQGGDAAGSMMGIMSHTVMAGQQQRSGGTGCEFPLPIACRRPRRSIHRAVFTRCKYDLRAAGGGLGGIEADECVLGV